VALRAPAAPVVDQWGRLNFHTRHALNHSDNARALVANADVVLGLELTDFWGTVNSYRDQLHRSSRSILKPGAKTIAISTRELGVKAFTMTDVDRLGMSRVLDEALAIVADGPGSVHVSFDMDGVDPQEAPGVGTPVRGGITYREAHCLMEGVAASGTLGSLEITEINPILDRENKTAILAVELILSALGKTTL